MIGPAAAVATREMAGGDPAAELTRAAVIDIGSNSVRLVIYRMQGRALWAVYNEKVLAGLGQDLTATGLLSVSGVAAALAALRRFHLLLVRFDGPVFVAATAAVREAADGPDFVAAVAAETGLRIRVLSGQEEARYAALGVLAGAPAATGVVADLGGSSLELVRLPDAGGRAAPADGVTLPLGPFAVAAKGGFDAQRVRQAAQKALKPVAARFRTPCLHIVGGAWRNLALLAMRLDGYPLPLVHAFEMTGREAVDGARRVVAQPRSALEKFGDVSKKRLDTLPHAAVILEALVEALSVKRVMLSAYGVREGLLLEALPPEVAARPPLLEGCWALAAGQGADEALGVALEPWLRPLLGVLPPLFDGRDDLLLGAACRLTDIGARLNPGHRPMLVFEQVLRAPLADVSHAERAFLALALYARHTSDNTPPEPEVLGRLLSPERRKRALALGAALRLGSDLCGRRPELLRHARLSLARDGLRLEATPEYAGLLLGEQTGKRAQALADCLGERLRMSAAGA